MNEEMKKILDEQYDIWSSKMQLVHMPPLVWRLIGCVVICPIKVLLGLLWSTVGVGTLFLITRVILYPWIFITRFEECKSYIYMDLYGFEIIVKAAWLITATKFAEFIIKCKTAIRPYSYKSWISYCVGQSYTDTIIGMHRDMGSVLNNIRYRGTDNGETGLCLDKCDDLIKELVSNAFKPKLSMRNGEMWIGE